MLMAASAQLISDGVALLMSRAICTGRRTQLNLYRSFVPLTKLRLKKKQNYFLPHVRKSKTALDSRSRTVDCKFTM